ncbi:helix-turn-helix transcriptional regulator [Lentzea albida]|uniref:Regulatory protein, luxR family n=1 Tax=Lentzea albida TaxID=65499 RepID=A0A1H9WIL2_9PSEU|nr:helix-turn-helix transcriptional regulator [Lentzea albida]SES33303.1 regulatory protein, luxR family [Lentzea albida]
MAGEQVLSKLGLTAIEEMLYRFFLRHPNFAPDLDEITFDTDRHSIDRAFERLKELGLVRHHRDRGVVAMDPVVGIEKLIEGRIEALNEELRNVSAARTAIPLLLEDQQAGRLSPVSSDIERIEGLDEIRARLDDLAFFAHREVMAMQPDGPLSAAYIEAARPLDLRCLRRGVRMRTIVLHEAVADDRTERYVQELVALGANVRSVEHSMERMIIYDRTVAVVPIDPGNSARGALIIRQPSLVTSMIALFERVWSDARPVVASEAPPSTEEHLQLLEKKILTVLSNSSKDEIAAREMGMSVRTFRRHVAELMTRLGASNRFQAALLAKDRGWL